MMEKVAAVLIAAHAIADFGLQPEWLVRKKKKVGYLLLHALIHAALTYVMLQAWILWQVPLFILVMHTLIDFVKVKWNRDMAAAFAGDQIAHALSLIGAAWLVVHFEWLHSFSGIGFQPLVVFAGFIAMVWGSGFLLHCLTNNIYDVVIM